MPLQNTADSASPLTILFRLSAIDTGKVTLGEAVKLALMILEILLNEDDSFVVSGCHLFIDTTDMNPDLNYRIPHVVRKVFKVLKKGYAVELKGVHIFNLPPNIKAMYDMLLMSFQTHYSAKIEKLVSKS